MADTGHPIFLDTQVFEAASFNFKTTTLASLEEQVEKGTVRLILTDITVREVKARIEKTVLAPSADAELPIERAEHGTLGRDQHGARRPPAVAGWYHVRPYHVVETP